MSDEQQNHDEEQDDGTKDVPEMSEAMTKYMKQQVAAQVGRARQKATEEVQAVYGEQLAGLRDELRRSKEESSTAMDSMGQLMMKLAERLEQPAPSPIPAPQPQPQQGSGIEAVLVALIQSMGQQQNQQNQQQTQMTLELIKSMSQRQGDEAKDKNPIESALQILSVADVISGKKGAGSDKSMLEQYKELSESGAVEDTLLAFMTVKGMLSKEDIEETKENKRENQAALDNKGPDEPKTEGDKS